MRFNAASDAERKALTARPLVSALCSGSIIMAHDVFISYASKDKPIADAVCATVEANGIRCWIAPRDVLPGMVYGKAIIRAISESQILVLVFTSASNSSSQVMREIERAVNRGLIIIPLRVENILPSEDIEFFISSSHWLDAWTPPLEAHLNQLAKTVSILLKPPSEQNTPDAQIRLTLHLASFVGSPNTPCCFINATNLCRDVDIEITHVWMESDPKVFATNPDRPLPKRLKPHETWETWIPLYRVPPDSIGENLYQLARARLSTGEIIHSVENKSVPGMGNVPGGPIRELP